ncbi:LysR substrate-binding domain-containing protein [Thalassotalea piscium]|uniref:LysR family glycine cleavage system transcriptional activator n=1 Tax=Thalassotalea piscium TaxID=1230533 RepID=A0A7X0NJL5_9GAMM|nr:LysR substrate-binding domain-containing protein [Thalassotalea piscium]MBB6544598.1 LysR family glycine cleavage system transcriptional activator [Thalassotalea piscium]
MAKTTPPLHLLTIFEASARHESFKIASDELFITPSAVSHQIKTLETYIGFPLFVRKSRGVSLNAAGKMYFSYVQQALTLIDTGTKKVKNKFSTPSLKINTFPTMASNVIIPQLNLFQTAHPEIDIRLATSMNLVDLRDEEFDLAIRVGHGNATNAINQKLLDIKITAVCSPEFAQQHQLNDVNQITKVPLIDLSYMDNIWQKWADAANIKETNFKHSLTFDNYDATLHAAEQGLGLALAMMPIENSLIERKVLVSPFKQIIPFQLSLYAIYREEDNNRHDIQCFLSWLIKSPNMKPLKNT